MPFPESLMCADGSYITGMRTRTDIDSDTDERDNDSGLFCF